MKCSSVVEAHDSRTGNEDLSTDKRTQEATKLPVPADRGLTFVDDDEGDEMVAPQGERLPDAQPPRQEAVDLPQVDNMRPQEIQEELLPDAQPPRQEAVVPPQAAFNNIKQRYPSRNRRPPDYF